jgi:hypothetical protein
MDNAMTAKQAAMALRRAAKTVDLAERYRPSRTAEETCHLVGEALRAIEDAQIVLRSHSCWRERAEADCAAVGQR